MGSSSFSTGGNAGGGNSVSSSSYSAGSSVRSGGGPREYTASGELRRPGAGMRNDGTSVDASPWYSRPVTTNPVTGASYERPSNPIIGGGHVVPGTPGKPPGRGAGPGHPGGGNPPAEGGGRGGPGHRPGQPPPHYGGQPGYGGGYPIYGWDEGYYDWGYGWGYNTWYDPFWSSSYGSYYGSGYGSVAPGIPIREPGGLHLKVKPETAKVYVDGYYAGTVDDFNGIGQRLKIEPGPHKIDIVADGFESISFEIAVISSQTINYQADMQPIR